jgi:CRP-like cAMP-binding protein
MQPTHSILKHFAGIINLTGEDLKVLENIMLVGHIDKNTIIQQPGTTCKTIYFVSDGVARIFYWKEDQDITEHFAFNDNIIIRAESLFQNQPTPKGIQAITPVQLVSIEADALFSLFPAYPNIERLFHKIIVHEYLQANKRIESLQMQTAHERYHQLMKETELVQLIPLKYIASYLGITQVSLSRIRGQK